LGRVTARVRSRTRRLDGRELDTRLRALLNHWTYWESEPQLQALGRPALQRLLDSLEGKVNLWAGKTEMDGREYEDACQAAVAACAKVNMASVLRAFKARGWGDLQIALSGIGRVPDPRVVPYLLAAYESKEATHRLSALNYLAGQRDDRATDALVRALGDRSSDVRRAAIDGLGEVGDARAIEPLRLVAKGGARTQPLAQHVKAAIAKIRRKADVT
jgi:hypothetical protein